jgi:translocation protein SEC62
MTDSPQQPSPGQQAPSPQGPPAFTLQPGQQPTPEQIEAIRRQLAIDAQKAGLSVPEFVQRLRQQAMAQQQAAMAQQQSAGGLTPQTAGSQGGLTPQTAGSPQSGLRPPQSAQTTTPGTAQPITPGPPNPAALAVAAFLKNQDLKMRTCILNGQRKDMFKGIHI